MSSDSTVGALHSIRFKLLDALEKCDETIAAETKPHREEPPDRFHRGRSIASVVLVGMVCLCQGNAPTKGVEMVKDRTAIDCAVMHLRNGNYSDAVTCANTAANGGADPVLALGIQAEAMFYMGNFGTASIAIDQLDTHPNRGRADYLRGLICQRKKQFADADHCFREAYRKGEWLALAKIGERP